MRYVDSIDKFFMEDNKHNIHIRRSEHRAKIIQSLKNIKTNETIIKNAPKKEKNVPVKILKKFDDHLLNMTAKEIEEQMINIRLQIERKYHGNFN